MLIYQASTQQVGNPLKHGQLLPEVTSYQTMEKHFVPFEGGNLSLSSGKHIFLQNLCTLSPDLLRASPIQICNGSHLSAPQTSGSCPDIISCVSFLTFRHCRLAGGTISCGGIVAVEEGAVNSWPSPGDTFLVNRVSKQRTIDINIEFHRISPAYRI